MVALSAAHAVAHPRVGGENSLKSSPFERAVGSSPRRRGKHLPLALAHGPVRLIPA